MNENLEKKLREQNKKVTALAADYVAKWQEEALFVKKLIGKEDEFKSVSQFLEHVWRFMHTQEDETYNAKKELTDLGKKCK